MDFFKEWMKNLLSMIVGISISIGIPTLFFLISYLLVKYLGLIGVGIISLILVSLAVTLENRCD